MIAFNDTVHTDGRLTASFQVTKESTFSKAPLASGLTLKLADDSKTSGSPERHPMPNTPCPTACRLMKGLMRSWMR